MKQDDKNGAKRSSDVHQLADICNLSCSNYPPRCVPGWVSTSKTDKFNLNPNPLTFGPIQYSFGSGVSETNVHLVIYPN